MHRKLLRPLARAAVAILACSSAAHADSAFCKKQPIFAANPKHNHASCVVQTKDGSLLAAWYSGSGERKSDDVVIEGAWLTPGESAWAPKFLLADTPGYPDCNPALFAAPDQSLWLFWPTILDHRWEGALLKFARSQPEPPPRAPIKWTQTGVVHVTPKGFADDMKLAVTALSTAEKSRHGPYLQKEEERSRDELYQRLGWMPRVHPLVLPSGR